MPVERIHKRLVRALGFRENKSLIAIVTGAPQYQGGEADLIPSFVSSPMTEPACVSLQGQ